jgi:hypothetical protein
VSTSVVTAHVMFQKQQQQQQQQPERTNIVAVIV